MESVRRDNGPCLADAKRLDCAGGFWLQTAGDHGTVSESPTKACYGNGETVSLQAVGDAGYAFQQWTGDLSGNQSVMDVTMDADKAILAQFFTGPVGVENPAPIEFALEEIRPNPTPGPVAITYSLPSAAHVKLAVYDIAGRQLGGLVNGVVAAGRRVARWDELSEGQAAKSGVYFVRYETPAGASTMRFVLLR